MKAAQDDIDARLRTLLEAHAVDGAATLLVERYGGELRSYLAALASSPDLAADAYAQLCEDLWRGLPGFAFRSSARTWLYTLARHALAREARHPRRRRERNLPLSAAQHVAREEAHLRAQTASYRRTTMKDRVQALRNKLAPEDRELLILRVDRGLDWVDVARVLADDDRSSSDELKKRSAALRKRFERLKDRLRAMAIAEGLVRAGPEPA